MISPQLYSREQMQLRPVYAAIAFVFAALRKQWAITVSAALPAVFTGHSLELRLCSMFEHALKVKLGMYFLHVVEKS